MDTLGAFFGPEWAPELDRLRREHIDRGCGVFGRGCACRCLDHPCFQRVEADRCKGCGGTGLVSSGLRRFGAEFRARAEKCPDCDTGCAVLSPELPWANEQRYTLDCLPDVPEIRKPVQAWLAGERERFPWLVLAGDVGRGKTIGSLAAGFALARLGARVRPTTAATILSNVKATFREDAANPGPTKEMVEAGFIEAEVLIVNDLGAEQGSEFNGAQLQAIFDARYDQAAVTIITTNLRPPPPAQSRLWSRIFGELSLKAVSEGPDLRLGRRQ